MRSAASVASVRAVTRSGPRPTTVRIRPAGGPDGAVGIPNCAAMEHEGAGGRCIGEALDRVAAPRRVGVAGGGQDDRNGGAGERRQVPPGEARPPHGGAQVASRRGEQDRAERDREPRQDRLCLGVPEARVALEQDGPVVGQHQPGVEGASERSAASGQLGQDRAVECVEEALGGVVGQVRQGAVCAHAAGVRALVAIEQSLVVSRSRQRDRIATIADRDEARLAAAEPLLDDDPRRRGIGRRRQGQDRGLRLGRRFADRHALAGREAIGLDDDAASGRGQLAGERDGLGRVSERSRQRHAHPGGLGNVVAERLARLDPGRRRGRPEDGDTRVSQRIGHAGGERRLGSDDNELAGLATGKRQDRGRIQRVDPGDAADTRFLRDGVAPRCDDDLVDARLGGQLPGERMLAPAAAHDEDPGRHDQAHAGNPARLRIGRQARSMVWVRSGPTDRSTIGTPAWSSIADT